VSGAAEGTADLVTVIRLDVRAGVSAPDAVAAGTIGPDTLAGIQQRAVRGLPGSSANGGKRRLVDVGRVLVTDDAAAFAGHAAAYQHLLLTPTIGRLLCVIVGTLADPLAIDLPGAVAADSASGTGVLWIGDPVGSGWHLGMTATTRLAEAGGDPDGTATLEEILGALTDPDVFDAALAAITAMDGNVAAPAVLPVVHWPALDVLRLAEELAVGGGPPAPHEIVSVLSPDVRQLLISLWSIAPAIAQCERLLAETESAARRLPRIPGRGGRRAWRAVTSLGSACAKLGPPGQFWEPVRFPSGLAAGLEQAPRARTLWHPVLFLGPLLIVAGAAGAGITLALRHLPTAGADGIAAACSAVVFTGLAFAWWRRATRRWLAGLSLPSVRAKLDGLASGIAAHGVDGLEEAATAWYRAQQRRLVTWWRLARRVMRERIMGEIASVLGQPVPGAQPVPGGLPDHEVTAADSAAVPDLMDPDLADIPRAVKAATADALALLAATVLDEDFIQLNAPGQLPLLDGSSRAAQLIRYAPARAREPLTAECMETADEPERMPLGDVAWTRTGQTIGVIRLVPARPGVLRIAGGHDPGGTVLQVEVSGGGDRAAEGLAAWLGVGNEPERQVTVAEAHVGPVIIVTRANADCTPVVKEVIDWLRTTEEPTEARFTRADGSTATVTSAQAHAATNLESDTIAASIAR
jgi:hypothetical protein